MSAGYVMIKHSLVQFRNDEIIQRFVYTRYARTYVCLCEGSIVPVFDHRPLEFIMRDKVVLEPGRCVRLTFGFP